MYMKILVAAAASALGGIACAQSSVTLFGVVDTALQHGSGGIAGKTQLGSSGLKTSRLGFRGKEDLGDGLWSEFWLEAGFNSDNGTGVATNTNNQASGATAANAGLVFNRRSTVGLGGGWGEIRIGRDFTPQYYNLQYEPTSATGVGTAVNYTNIITGPAATRASNGISYILPSNLGGFYGQLQYYAGENLSNAANKDDGSGGGARFGYAAGNLDVAVATGYTSYAAGGSRQTNLGLKYDFGILQLLADISHDEGLIQASAAPAAAMHAKASGWSLGTVVPVGANELRLGYSRYSVDVQGTALVDPSASKVMVGWVHNFTKRTATYATYAHVSNSGGWATALNGAVTNPNGSSSGYELGLRHAF